MVVDPDDHVTRLCVAHNFTMTRQHCVLRLWQKNIPFPIVRVQMAF